jgi:hypothetical protein
MTPHQTTPRQTGPPVSDALHEPANPNNLVNVANNEVAEKERAAS